MTSRKSISTIGCLAIPALLVMCQINASAQGKNEEVTIIAPYIPTIGDASKFPFRPEVTPENPQAQSFEYQYLTRSVETNLELDPIDPVRVSDGKQQDLYRNFARVGFGNYLTPYAEFMASNLQSDQYQFGARLKHHSSQSGVKGYDPEAFSHNLVSVFARTFLKNHTLSGDAGYQRDVCHFYGFPTDSFPGIDIIDKDLKQRFQHFHIGADLRSHYKDRDKAGHYAGLQFHTYSDFYQTREFQLSVEGGINAGLPSSSRDFSHGLDIGARLDYIGYRDTVNEINPLYIEIKPVYRFGFGQYSFRAGISVDMLAEQRNGAGTFGIDVFPELSAEVVIIESKLKAFAALSGQRTIQSFRSLTGLNPYITSTPEIRPTDRQIKFGGGIEGNAGGLNFLAEASYSYVAAQPLFITDTSLTFNNKFIIIYEDLNALNVRASLGYLVLNRFSAGLTANFWHYIPSDEEKAWQMPGLEVEFRSSYRFAEKYTVKASFLALGSRYAKTWSETGQVLPEKMKGAFDLSLGAEYRINKMIAVFVDASNILNQNYQRWYHYPVQGILVMAGGKISF